MKLSPSQVESLVRKVVSGLEKQNLVSLTKGKQAALARARDIVLDDFKKEAQLDAEVEKLMDQMEAEGGPFQRHKMFGKLKQKLADEKGVVL